MNCFHAAIKLFMFAISSLAYYGEIHDAAEKGDLEKVKVLLKANSDLVSSKDDKGYEYTPLHLAAMGGHKDIVELLLSKKADVNAKDKCGSTPLQLAVDRNYKEVVKLLLAKGANVNAKPENSGGTPLSLAAANSNADIVKLLLAAGADVNGDQGDGTPPLIEASRIGSKEVVKLLLAKGADIKGDRGVSALLVAIESDREEVVELLLVKINVNASLSAKGGWGMTPLLEAVQGGHKDLVKLLLAKGANCNAKHTLTGDTPLHWAVGLNTDDVAEIVKMLLAAGADVNAKDEWGGTPLHEAAAENSNHTTKHTADVVKLLLAARADVNAKHGEAYRGATPLHFAVDSGSDVVKLLLAAGANVNAKDDDGFTPLHKATEEHKEDIQELLRKHGGVE